MTDKPDSRVNAYRADLANSALRGRVTAERYVEGRQAVVCGPVVNLHAQPSAAAAIDTQALLGETVRVFDETEGWSWVQLDADHYVGYVPTHQLADPGAAATHVVSAPRSFIYGEADLRSPLRYACSMGSRVSVTGTQVTRGTHYCLLADGTAIIAGHLQPVSMLAADYVDVATLFLQTPYLWGGRSGMGLDCSALVQLSMMMCGQIAPRDTNMQEASLGRPVDTGPAHAPDFTSLQRGDLVFWQGHVAIVEDGQTILHANGHTMLVTREPLAEAIGRIAHLYGLPTSVRRPGVA